VTTGAGMVEVKAPRVDDRRQGQHYRPVILPAYMRKSPKVNGAMALATTTGRSVLAPEFRQLSNPRRVSLLPRPQTATLQRRCRQARWSTPAGQRRGQGRNRASNLRPGVGFRECHPHRSRS
jgi:hypothetical protein